MYEELQVGKKDLSGKPLVPELDQAVPLNYQVVSLWKRASGGDKEIAVEGKLEIVDPNGKQLLAFPHQVKIDQGKTRGRMILQFNAFKITDPGEYVFKLSAKEAGAKNFVEVSENYLVVKFVM